jgi:hypothetical protein
MHTNNEKLRKALEECMQKDFAFIPSDKEIKKWYTPSEKFKKQMNQLIRKEKLKEKFKFVTINKKRIYQVAAGAAILILGINIGAKLLIPNIDRINLTSQSPKESTTETTESALADKALDQMAPDQSAEEANLRMEVIWSVDSIHESEAVLRLENTTEEPFVYTTIQQVEKFENDNWVTIYFSEKLEEKSISSNESIEETITLSDYNIKESGSYRLYRTINQQTVTIDIEIP